MNITFLVLSFILISCGKPKSDGSQTPDRIPPRVLVTTTTHAPAERLETQCYTSNPAGDLVKAYTLRGTFYKGTIWICESGSCMGHGMYFHYFEPSQSCLTKRGFEETLTMCMERDKVEERSSTLGTLVRMDATIDSRPMNLWCLKNILKILFYQNSTEA